MKVIIAGSRTIVNPRPIDAAMAHFMERHEVTRVLSGNCRGVDLLGEAWAERHGLPVDRYPAAWHMHGNGAGPLRNRQMADYADALVAIMTHANSSGTRDMVHRALRRKMLGYSFVIYVWQIGREGARWMLRPVRIDQGPHGDLLMCVDKDAAVVAW